MEMTSIQSDARELGGDGSPHGRVPISHVGSDVEAWACKLKLLKYPVICLVRPPKHECTSHHLYVSSPVTMYSEHLLTNSERNRFIGCVGLHHVRMVQGFDQSRSEQYQRIELPAEFAH